jgi:hypothetical protein
MESYLSTTQLNGIKSSGNASTGRKGIVIKAAKISWFVDA